MSSDEIKALESTIQPRKPSRVRKFKEDYVNENTQLRMDNHAIGCMNLKLLESNATLLEQLNNPTITLALRLLVKAVVRKVRVV